MASSQESDGWIDQVIDSAVRPARTANSADRDPAPPAARADGQHRERGEHAADDVERDLDLGGRVQRKAAAGPQADGGQRGGERRAEEELGRRAPPPAARAAGRLSGLDQAGRRLWTRRLVPKPAALRPPMASKARIASSGAGRSATPLVLAPPSGAGVDRAAVDLDRRVAGGDRLLEARALRGRGGVQRVDGGRRCGARVAGAAARGAAGAGGDAPASTGAGAAASAAVGGLAAAEPCSLDLAAAVACTRRGRPGGWRSRPRSPSASSGRRGCRRRSP